MFQQYIFDSYKYQVYFNISTSEIRDKITDALWPFHPDSQPEGLVTDYDKLLKQIQKLKPKPAG